MLSPTVQQLNQRGGQGLDPAPFPSGSLLVTYVGMHLRGSAVLKLYLPTVLTVSVPVIGMPPVV